jgi:Kef-type K+ transport system membrane component KefB
MRNQCHAVEFAVVPVMGGIKPETGGKFPANNLRGPAILACLSRAARLFFRGMEHGIATDIAICIIAAWLFSVLSQALRQPLLLAYLVAGFVIGPHGVPVGPGGHALITNPKSIQTISDIGLALLLFMLGLEIDLKKMLSAGRVITVTATIQILGCVALGWLAFAFVGIAETGLGAFYLAVAAAMSSTVIIVKILYDKRELETVAGRVTLGVLVLQDVFVILFLALQPNLRNPALIPMVTALGKVILLVSVAFLTSRFVLPTMFRLVARLPEVVLVGALAWCFAMSGFAGWLGISTAMGALIAGVMVSTFPYTLDVVAKVTSIRDFFVTLFFVGLGLEIPVPTWGAILWAVFLCVFLIASRLATVFPPLYRMRQGYRGSLLPAINLSQISELSLVLLALGKASGDVSDNLIGIVAFAFAFLAVGSTYAIIGSHSILSWATPWLNRLDLHDLDQSEQEAGVEKKAGRVCILGFSWTASSLLEEISRERSDLLEEIVIIDFNPLVYARLRERGIQAVYGDITSRDTLLHAGVNHAKVIICSLPNTVLKGSANFKMLLMLRSLNPEARIIVHAELLSDVPKLYAAGASYVTAPRLLEAADLLDVIEADEQHLLEQKHQTQQKLLENRDEIIP